MRTLEEQLTEAGRNVRQVADQLPDLRIPSARGVQRGVTVAVAVAIAVALFGLSIILWGDGDGTEIEPATKHAPLPDLFFAVGFIPDGLEPTESLTVLINPGFDDSGEPFATIRTFSAVGDPDPDIERLGEVWLSVTVVDAFAVTEQRHCVDREGEPRDPEQCRADIPASACDGTEAMAAGAVDPRACVAEAIEDDEPFRRDADVAFTETEVRGRPALLRVETASDYSVTTLFVYERNEIVTRVDGFELDQETVLRVAEDLRPVTRAQFEADTP